MISFSLGEILGSVIYALAYGVVFSVAFSLCRLIRGILFALPEITIESIKYKKIFPLPNFKQYIDPKIIGPLFGFVWIIIFTLGFILISYFSLDGVIRIYMLLIAFASFYLSNFLFCDILNKILLFILNLILQLFCLILRVIILPFKKLLHIKTCHKT